MLKKTGFIAGISLMLQGFTFLVLFILITARKKSLTAALVGLAAICFGGGFLLARQELADELEAEKVADAVEYLSDLRHTDVPDRPAIPVDDTVNEEEFR